ncbi:hypothetical protein RN001_010320 [Aquatica leii]|uniref:Uncharacterized protein n=1 Tax=Aquatica leii TaxID=1421715 RepID=A0AAN7SFZ3_9COLE|nr:hypothetical protein RN001_010320 [Aquatica leii]
MNLLFMFIIVLQLFFVIQSRTLGSQDNQCGIIECLTLAECDERSGIPVSLTTICDDFQINCCHYVV